MENMRQLLERGLISGIMLAAVFAGFAGFLYLLYRLIKSMRPKQLRQEEQRILSHRFYKVSGRGRAAYLILCLEETLRFYKQDFAAWDWILRQLWSITDDAESSWIDAWLDSVGVLLPSMVLTSSSDNAVSEEIYKARNLYTQAGNAMIVINAIFENAYTMVGEWSPHTAAHDPDALCLIDETEETMKKFGVPLPSEEMIQRLLLEQKDFSFGKVFDGLQFSCLSKGESCSASGVLLEAAGNGEVRAAHTGFGHAVQTAGGAKADRVTNMQTRNSCYTYFKIVGNFDPDEVTRLLALQPEKTWKIGDYRRNGTKYDFAMWQIGRCEDYDADVEKQMRKTISPLLNKIGLLNQIYQNNHISFVLEIVPTIYVGDQNPCLAPPLDVIDFCHETRTEIDIDMYVMDSADE